MRSGGSQVAWLMAAGVLLLSALAGMLIPLASGSRPGGMESVSWTPPPSPTSTVRPAPSATFMSVSPGATTAIPKTSMPRPTSTAVSTAAAMQPLSNTLTATLTPAPSATPPAPSPTPSPAPVGAGALGAEALGAGALGAGVSVVRVSATALLLRTGPGAEYPIVAIAAEGDTFTLTGRNADRTWWRVCCVSGTPVWLSAEFVTVTGPADQAPVVP